MLLTYRSSVEQLYGRPLTWREYVSNLRQTAQYTYGSKYQKRAVCLSGELD